MIFAVLKKQNGRGNQRCWIAWKFNSQYSSPIEDFMIAIGYDTRQYFLLSPNMMQKNKKYPYHWMYFDQWVWWRPVKVKRTKNGYEFTVKFK